MQLEHPLHEKSNGANEYCECSKTTKRDPVVCEQKNYILETD